jgi:hypothetical protein
MSMAALIAYTRAVHEGTRERATRLEAGSVALKVLMRDNRHRDARDFVTRQSGYFDYIMSTPIVAAHHFDLPERWQLIYDDGDVREYGYLPDMVSDAEMATVFEQFALSGFAPFERRPNGIWRGSRRTEIVDYLFVYRDSDGWTASQTFADEFVDAYPRYLPDGEYPSTVDDWWLEHVLKEKHSDSNDVSGGSNAD